MRIVNFFGLNFGKASMYRSLGQCVHSLRRFYLLGPCEDIVKIQLDKLNSCIQNQHISVRNDLDWFRLNIEDLSVFKLGYYSFTTVVNM